MTDPESRTDEWLTSEDTFSRAIGCLQSHAPVSLAEWPYLSLSDLRKSCAAMHCMMPSFCICTPGKEVGLIMRLYAPKKEMRYKYLHKIDRVKVEIVHILEIITAVTQNHGNCQKSQHAQSENHGNHGDREFVIYIHPYQ